MYCHICLKEEVEGKIDRLELCKKCLKAIRPYWEKEDTDGVNVGGVETAVKELIKEGDCNA